MRKPILVFVVTVVTSVAILALVMRPQQEPLHEPTPPPHGFSVSISPADATIGKPFSGYNSTTVSVTVEPVDNYNKQVTLSYSPSLTGVTIIFSQENGIPEFISTMEIRVGPEAELGTTAITVRGEGADGVENTATFQLEIRT